MLRVAAGITLGRLGQKGLHDRADLGVMRAPLQQMNGTVQRFTAAECARRPNSQQVKQHLASFVSRRGVGWQLAIRDSKSNRPNVVSDYEHGNISAFSVAVFYAGRLTYEF